ncbi:MAG: hypothetical protein R2724_01375 [Bryobacterales bacterium]
MSNVLTIARRELRVYFSSPIAYIVLAMFGVIFGFFFYSAVAFFPDVFGAGGDEPRHGAAAQREPVHHRAHAGQLHDHPAVSGRR